MTKLVTTKEKNAEANQLIVIYCSVASIEAAREISNQLIENRLIACSNIIQGVESHYFWRGQVERENEFVLLLKTLDCKFAAVEALILKVHPYDTPCVYSLPTSRCSRKYKEWVEEQVTSPAKP